MSRVVVLMYHALYADERERASIDAADRPYALPVVAFARQLEAFAQAGLAILDPARLETDVPSAGGVVLTFDDGHASNHAHALPLLVQHRVRAAFFITSDFVDRRPGFCSRRQLRDLADAGMTVGTHGRTHRFFDDLTLEEARAELRDSKTSIEDATARPVTQMSFPGGRWSRPHPALGRALGYRLFHTSDIGTLASRPVAAGAMLSRIAIRETTALDRCVAIAHADASVLVPAQALAIGKSLARRVLGNRLYQRAYERFAS